VKERVPGLAPELAQELAQELDLAPGLAQDQHLDLVQADWQRVLLHWNLYLGYCMLRTEAK
jgi:hypothetical protein